MEPVNVPEVSDPLLTKLLEALEPWEAVFVIEYAKTGNSAHSYRAAKPHVAPSTVASCGWRMLLDERIADAVRVARRSVCEDVLIEARDVVREWAMIAAADPAELMRMVHRCCRHCHGEGFAFQWKDESEYAQACQTALDGVMGTDAAPVLPDCSGGFGFNARNPVVAECPACKGEGQRETFIEATENLSARGRKLFAGIKQTKDGIEIKTRDQDAALRNLAQHLGMLSTDVKLKGQLHVANSQVELTDEQRAVLLAAVRGLDI